MFEIESDPEFQELIRCISHPPLERIVALAKRREIKEVHEFWDLFDLLGRRWRELRSWESLGELC